MIIVKITGGLGNQMFQYAYAKALEGKGYKVKIDISTFDTYKLHGGYQLNKYDIGLKVSTLEENKYLYKDNIAFKILKRLGFRSSKIVKEKSLLFDKGLLCVDDDSYIQGYFQSEKYFIDIRQEILKQFTIISSISNYTQKIEKKIITSPRSCSIHIRRGDFTNSVNQNIHGTCDLDYYKKAISYIQDKIGDVRYFIFSDDIVWVKKNLKVDNIVYVDSLEKRIPHEDIYLMSLCHHNIIANSSFSWWGAWLNQNDEKVVISPERWFSDNTLQAQSNNIVCKNWIKL